VMLGCNSMAETPPNNGGSASDKNGSEQPVSTGFASDRDPKKDVADVPFDSKRAMGYIEELCKIGPRISGTDGMKKQQEYLKKHFEDLGAKVQMQEFKAQQRSRRDKVELANMIITWHPDRTRRVILCSHYDTRPLADQESDQRNWQKPFLSANDGGSGVAFLMELGHAMKDLKTEVGVDFVLFDGEEFVYDGPHGADQYFFGSNYFASNYTKEKPKHKYVAAVLLDMIAGKNPRFPVEMNSNALAKSLVDDIWGIAEELKCRAFSFTDGPTVGDDHLALNRERIPAVDIIDFKYKHWHRLTDVPENCSPEGLDQVAKVLTTWLVRMKAP
jgi:glutaminyl-peptide cyclotransferase